MRATGSGAEPLERGRDKTNPDTLAIMQPDCPRSDPGADRGRIGLLVLGMAAAALGYIKPVRGALLQEAIDVAVILRGA